VTGVGEIGYAVVEFPGGRLEDPFDVTAAGIESRGDR